MSKFNLPLGAWALLGLAALLGAAPSVSAADFRSVETYDWTEVNEDAAWTARAGLQVLEKDDKLYLIGGRTPKEPTYPPIPGDSDIWGDVWLSEDLGASWVRILETDDADHWPARAYFEAVCKDDYMYVIGGQNFLVVENPDCPPPYIDCLPFLPSSDFFSDVWRSQDGINWTLVSADAGWEPRAGLSAVVFQDEIYVLGGSQNDDDSVGGPGGPDRIYFNDVWKSTDGLDWTQVTDAAPWTARAGARVVVKDDYLYLLGGEEGFFCQPPCDPPYFNDVWRTQDGANWELVTEAAPWSPRPGHHAAVIGEDIIMFGGFGLSQDLSDPFGSDNPMDIWVSRDGADWLQVSASPWNAVSNDEIKYDFDALVLPSAPGSEQMSIYTFGGDREDFDFTDPINYLEVDNDVWRATAIASLKPYSFEPHPGGHASAATRSMLDSPEVAGSSVQIQYSLESRGPVELAIFDIKGRRLQTLFAGDSGAGQHGATWNGRDSRGRRVSSGIYFARLEADRRVESRRIVFLR